MRRPEHFPTWSWDPPCRKTWENRSSRDLIPRWNLEPKQSHFTAFMGAETWSRAVARALEGLPACKLPTSKFQLLSAFQSITSTPQAPASSLHLLIGGPPPGGVLKAAPSASAGEEPTLASANPPGEGAWDQFYWDATRPFPSTWTHACDLQVHPCNSRKGKNYSSL